MAAVAPGTISFKQMAAPAGGYGPQMLVCGSCGTPVVDEHLQTHIAYHATPGWVSVTLVPNVPPGTK
jgi:hypothetical protein